MTQFLLYEDVKETNAEGVEIVKHKIHAEGKKFRNGKLAVCFNYAVPVISVYDNIEQFASLHCNETMKIFTPNLVEKTE